MTPRNGAGASDRRWEYMSRQATPAPQTPHPPGSRCRPRGIKFPISRLLGAILALTMCVAPCLGDDYTPLENYMLFDRHDLPLDGDTMTQFFWNGIIPAELEGEFYATMVVGQGDGTLILELVRVWEVDHPELGNIVTVATGSFEVDSWNDVGSIIYPGGVQVTESSVSGYMHVNGSDDDRIAVITVHDYKTPIDETTSLTVAVAAPVSFPWWIETARWEAGWYAYKSPSSNPPKPLPMPSLISEVAAATALPVTKDGDNFCGKQGLARLKICYREQKIRDSNCARVAIFGGLGLMIGCATLGPFAGPCGGVVAGAGVAYLVHCRQMSYQSMLVCADAGKILFDECCRTHGGCDGSTQP